MGSKRTRELTKTAQRRQANRAERNESRRALGAIDLETAYEAHDHFEQVPRRPMFASVADSTMIRLKPKNG